MKQLRTDSALCDVTVIGGGPAGCAAALTSARLGARVCLLERSDVLGGAAVHQLVTHASSTNGKDFQGIWHELHRTLRERGGFSGLRKIPIPFYPEFTWLRGEIDPECVKRVWAELLLQAGVEIFLGCTVIGAEVRERRLGRLTVFAHGGRYSLEPNMVIDASGNGDAAHLAGCRETRINQAASLIGQTPEGEGRKSHYLFRSPADPLEPGEYSRAMLAMLQEADPAWKTAGELGIRSSRIIHAREQVTNAIAWELRSLPNEAARCSWELDLHPLKPGPVDSHLFHSGSESYRTRRAQVAAGSCFSIPAGALIAADLENLFLAGRIIDAEPWAHGALRIQQTCMATGEAAGMMAARAAELGRLPEPAEMEPLMRQLETLRAEQEK